MSPDEPRQPRLSPATTLRQMVPTLMPAPLESLGEIGAFYRDSLQHLRGVDRIGELRLSLEDAAEWNVPLKAFLFGHPGVGKTTELANLLVRELSDRFQPLWIRLDSELNPPTLRHYDVLLLVLLRLIREATDPTLIGFEDHELGLLMRRVEDHLATKWTKRLRVRQSEFSGGLSIPVLARLLANLKQSNTREAGQQDYEVSFVSELMDLSNEVVTECNRLLAKHRERQWVVVLEDSEKLGIPAGDLRDLFSGLRPYLQGLACHVVVTIPVWLRHSQDAVAILPPGFHQFDLTDIAVYREDHTPNEAAIAALTDIVLARADPGLFEAGVLRRGCIASGGNIRDLFRLIRGAMLTARLRRAGRISAADLDSAVSSLRDDYKSQLGSTSPEEEREAGWDEKIAKLVAIYRRDDPAAEVPSPVLYALLRQRCVLKYNGRGWLGLHPLVVDLLIEFQKLEPGSPGGSVA